MIELLYFAIICFSAFSLGKKIFDKFKINASFLEIVVFSVSIGFAVFAYATLALGIAGLLYKSIFLLLITTPLLFSKSELLYFAHELKSILNQIKKLRFGISLILIIVLSIFVLLNMIASFSPPYLWDEVFYNLAVPKIYVRHHEIIPIYDEFRSNYPFNINMLFTIGLLIKNAALSKLFMFGYGTLLALAIYTFSRRYFSLRASLFAATVYYTMPMISNHISSAYVDIGVAFYIFIAYYAFYLWYETDKINWFFVSSIMTGLSLATKHTALYYLPPLFLWLIYTLFFKKKASFIGAFKKTFLYFMIALLFAMPWYVKSYIYTGNPIYPFADSFLRNTYLNPFQIQSGLSSGFFESNVLGAVGERTLPNFLAKFWDITMHSSKYGMLLGFGPVFLAFVPLVIMMKKISKAEKFLLLYSVIAFIIWFYGPQVFRYLMIYPMLSIISGNAIDSLLNIKRVKIFVMLVLISSLFFNLALWYGANSVKIPYIFGLESEQSFYLKLKDNNGYNVFDYANKHLPPNSKLLLFREYRGYLSDFDYVIGDPLNQKVVDYSKANNGEEMYKELTKAGITHVFINTKLGFAGIHSPSQPPRFSKKILDLMDETLKLHGRLLFAENGIYLYELVN